MSKVKHSGACQWALEVGQEVGHRSLTEVAFSENLNGMGGQEVKFIEVEVFSG